MFDQQADSHPDEALAHALLRTVLYADVFSFPLTLKEIQHFMIGLQADLGQIEAAIPHIPALCRVNGFVVLADHAHYAELRERREQFSRSLWQQARRYGWLLAHLPFVRMVALTGALAMRNAEDNDDIDYLIVTTPGRVWLTRALAVLLVRVARLWGVQLCPNYVLAESALRQTRQDLFMAHEIAQMIPLTGFPLYERMRAENAWVEPLLPNAQRPFHSEPDCAPSGIGKSAQRLAEWILSGPLGSALERWEQRRKLRKFAPQVNQPASSAQLDNDHVKGHFQDHGFVTLQQYRDRLERYNIGDHQTVIPS